MRPTDVTDNSDPAPRRRNAAESRERLLRAAQELFAERGYERATMREVGRRAEVDPAMIARYFGGKAGLYLETLRLAHPVDDEPLDLTDASVVLALLDRIGARRSTPTLHAAVRPHEDRELQAAAMDALAQRMVAPSQRIAEQSGQDQPRLRADLVTAALAGIVLGRMSGQLGALAEAPSADVARLTAELTGAILQPGRGE